jgi:dUTP pyrophosphatase
MIRKQEEIILTQCAECDAETLQSAELIEFQKNTFGCMMCRQCEDFSDQRENKTWESKPIEHKDYIMAKVMEHGLLFDGGVIFVIPRDKDIFNLADPKTVETKNQGVEAIKIGSEHLANYIREKMGIEKESRFATKEYLSRTYVRSVYESALEMQLLRCEYIDVDSDNFNVTYEGLIHELYEPGNHIYWRNAVVDIGRIPRRSRDKFELQFIKQDPTAIIPKLATPHASGFDLVMIKKVWEKPEENLAMYDSGIIVIPEVDVATEIRARSSIYKIGCILANGVGTIDTDYRGTLKIVLLRTNSRTAFPEPPFTCCQLVPVHKPIIVGFDVTDDTIEIYVDRKEGFGSTGEKGAHS